MKPSKKSKSVFSDCHEKLGSITTDLYGNIIHLNMTAEKIIGYSSFELAYNENILNLLHNNPQLNEKDKVVLHKVLQLEMSSDVQQTQWVFIDKQKEIKECEVMLLRLFDKKLELNGYLILFPNPLAIDELVLDSKKHPGHKPDHRMPVSKPKEIKKEKSSISIFMNMMSFLSSIIY